jgi:hypothetical protein
VLHVKLLSLAVLTLIASTSCAVFEPATSDTTLEEGKPHWFEYNAERRGSFMIPRIRRDAAGKEIGRDTVVLSEPSPDAATAATLKIAAKAADKGEISADFSKEIVVLGQRTQAVMLLREAMYRLSEMSQNTAMEPAKAEELYTKVLDSVKAIALAEISASDARKEEAKSEQEKSRTLRFHEFNSLYGDAKAKGELNELKETMKAMHIDEELKEK